MTELPNTETNVQLIQDYIDETKNRLKNGVTITFTSKSSRELNELAINHSIGVHDIKRMIMNLSVANYYRGIDPSGASDFQVCAFRIGFSNLEIYLKFGLENDGVQILLFSNHEPNYPMNQPFNN